MRKELTTVGFGERDIKTMKAFGIGAQMKKLHAELMALPDIKDVEYDLSSFWSDIPYVIFLPTWNIPAAAKDYFDRKTALLQALLTVAHDNGLTRTGDRIEDYGSCWYIVTRCNWNISEKREPHG